MTPYFLTLNEAAIIVVPDSNSRSDASRFVQIVVTTRLRPPPVDVLAAFFYAQRDITAIIESLVVAHLKSAAPKEVLLEGQGYILRGAREPWPYGKKLKLGWGALDLIPSDEKWVFMFEIGRR